MWLHRIKETLHHLLNLRWHVAELCMIDPVSSGIHGERKVLYGAFVDFVIELKENTEGSLCENRMCGFGENMIVRKAFLCCREAVRHQELFDGEMGKLNNL